MGTTNKLLDENNNDRKLEVRSYRLLAKCKNDNDSCIVRLKGEIPHNRRKEKEVKSNNEKWNETKNNLSFIGLSKIERGCKKVTKDKYNIFETKKHSYLEKKIFKEQDYFDFLKMNRTISDKVYRETVFKKFRLRIFAPVTLILLLSIYMILDSLYCCGLKWLLIRIVTFFHGRGWYGPLHKYLECSIFSGLFKSTSGNELVRLEISKRVGEVTSNVNKIRGHIYVESFFGYLVYILPLLIISVTLILGVFYYHKKIKKYQKIKFTKRQYK
ncbi:Plasmodium exported protein (Pm-fam-a like), unknown function [Plasmodium malariae]|uniref:Fam-l protein n=1 Tax=Plasmodium malariae TaxID=5858 RepID=A0A1A8WWE5_PLAMA|nr:Plasmodium exported protein (Pm-fam-a like), unknown function [Plasmodium malariae]